MNIHRREYGADRFCRRQCGRIVSLTDFARCGSYCERYLGVIHGFYQLSGVCESAKRCIRSIANMIKN